MQSPSRVQFLFTFHSLWYNDSSFAFNEIICENLRKRSLVEQEEFNTFSILFMAKVKLQYVGKKKQTQCHITK